MKNYVPDPAVIQKKANWKNLSVALRSYKHTFEDIAELAKLEKNSQEAMEPVEKDRKEEREVLEKKREKASRTAEEKEKALQEAIQKKLDLVSMLYAKAGMPLSMPPDMAKDEKLRERLISECNSLMGLGVALKALSERIAEEKNLHDKEGKGRGARDRYRKRRCHNLLPRGGSERRSCPRGRVGLRQSEDVRGP